MSIEGIPDGWESVAIRKAEPSEPILDDNGKVAFWAGKARSRRVFLILKKIEKPKRYRPFANAAEFEPHRDKWLVFFDYEYYDLSDQKSKVLTYGDDRFWIGEDGTMYDWNEAFNSLKFEDGTPFGVEVTE